MIRDPELVIERDIGPTAELARRDEKVTVNLAPVTVGLIDLLVAIGYSRNRSDLIRGSVQLEMNQRRQVIEMELKRLGLRAGSMYFDVERLEDMAAMGKREAIKLAGRLEFARDVTPEIVNLVIDEARVIGVVRGPDDVIRSLRVKRTL